MLKPNLIAAIVVCALVAAGCSSASPSAEETPVVSSPTPVATAEPTSIPTAEPTALPTEVPTEAPTEIPAVTPTPTPEPSDSPPEGIELKRVSTEGPWDYPAKGLEQLIIQDLADFLWAFLEMMNSLEVIAAAQDPKASSWYNDQAQRQIGDLMFEGDQVNFDEYTRTGIWPVSTDEAQFSAVKFEFLDEKGDGVKMTLCMHYSWQDFDEARNVVASGRGTALRSFDVLRLSGLYNIVGGSNIALTDGEFTGCPGEF